MVPYNQHMHVVDYGGDGEVLVLLHGFLASSSYWRKLQPLLTHAGYRVITIDLLGFGHAPKPSDAEYNYKDHTNHVKAAIDSLSLPVQFTLIGHSMGALIAMRFAKEYDSRISSLILLHPPLYTSKQQAYSTLLATGRHYRLLIASRMRPLAWGIVRIALKKSSVAMKHTKKSREGSLHQVIIASEGLSDLALLTTKTLLLFGSRDRREYSDNVKSVVLPENIHCEVADVTHHSPLTHPAMVYGLINEF